MKKSEQNKTRRERSQRLEDTSLATVGNEGGGGVGWGPVVFTMGHVAGDPVLGQRLSSYLGQGCRKQHCLSTSRCQPMRSPELWQSSFQEAAGPGGHPQTWHIAGGTHTILWPPEGNTEQHAGKRMEAQTGARVGCSWDTNLSQAAVLDFILEDESVGVWWLKPAQEDTALASCLPLYLPWDTISLSCGRGHQAARSQGGLYWEV